MNVKNKITAILTCMIFISCQSDVSKAYVPESNGNINTLTVVMNNNMWEGKPVSYTHLTLPTKA